MTELYISRIINGLHTFCYELNYVLPKLLRWTGFGDGAFKEAIKFKWSP